MILGLVALLVLLWLLGLIAHVGGAVIHFLLVVAVIVFIIDFLRGRNRV